MSSYKGDRFAPADTVALVVEVAGTSLSHDLGARPAADIPEQQIVDVNGRCVITHWKPSGRGYAERGEVPFGDRLVSATIENLEIDSEGLIG